MRKEIIEVERTDEFDPESKKEPVNKRWVIAKIDLFVLSFVCLQYWINYVDRIGFTNAYVSGMKADLKMVGKDLSIANTCFTVGYVVGMIPHNLILLKVPPRIWLSFCTFAWGILTLGMYHVTHFHQVCVLRFFQALFELHILRNPSNTWFLVFRKGVAYKKCNFHQQWSCGVNVQWLHAV